MHAVVVDPSRVVLKLVSELIAERGDEVTEVQDSASALRSIKSDPTIDVLITSLEVQPLSGLELCWEARIAMAAQRPLYIVVMSSLSDDHRLTEALDCGADDLIAKPVRRLELHARLRLAGRLASAQLHLVHLAETDPLTGLLNRRAFFDRLNAALQARPKAVSLSAILFDIDHFKRINDTYGHDVGDAVIRQIASEAAKRAKLVGRLGGEEFAIVLQGSDEAQSVRFAEGLRRTCASLVFTPDGEPFGITCSFGVSYCFVGETADQMLKRADIALYQAKAAGRNRVYGDSQVIAQRCSS
jgi:two-component system cell cycle response regulator